MDWECLRNIIGGVKNNIGGGGKHIADNKILFDRCSESCFRVCEIHFTLLQILSESLKLSYMCLKLSGPSKLNFGNFGKYYRNRRNWSLGILSELSNFNELSLKSIVILIVIGKDELQLLVRPSIYYRNIIGMHTNQSGFLKNLDCSRGS